MKTKMSFKRAALPVIATLLTAVISFTGVTYAWFTSGTTATVDQIDVNVEAAGGLQIAINPIGNVAFEWGSNYAPEDTLQNVEFSPMSAAATVNTDTDTLNFYKASLSDTLDKIYTFVDVNEAEEKNNSYISFDMYFRNPEVSAKKVDLEGTIVSALAKNSHQAARIAFITQSNVSSNATGVGATNFANGTFAVGTGLSQTVTIFEPNATAHSTYGIAAQQGFDSTASATEAYGYLAIAGASETNVYYDRFTGEGYTEDAKRNEKTTGGVDEATGKYYIVNGQTNAWSIAADYQMVSNASELLAANAAKVYFVSGVNAAITAEPTLVEAGHTVNYDANTYYICKPVVTYTKAAASTNLVEVETITDVEDAVFELQAQSITKVTVIIWMEGQDVECENNTSGEGFSVQLKFNAKDKV